MITITKLCVSALNNYRNYKTQSKLYYYYYYYSRRNLPWVGGVGHVQSTSPLIGLDI